MPEGKRVAGMEAAVLELVHGPEHRQRVEFGELAHARQVEEQVAADRPRRPPDEAGERNRGADHGEAGPAVGPRVDGYLLPHRAEDEPRHERRRHDHCERDEPDDERRGHEEDDAESEEDEHEADGERRGDRDAERPGQPQRAQDQPAGQQEHEERRHREPQSQPGAFSGQEAHEAQRQQRPARHEHGCRRARLDSAAGLGDPGR